MTTTPYVPVEPEEIPTKAEAEELARENQQRFDDLPQTEKDRIRELVGQDPWQGLTPSA
jgi:hypothetical protein